MGFRFFLSYIQRLRKEGRKPGLRILDENVAGENELERELRLCESEVLLLGDTVMIPDFALVDEADETWKILIELVGLGCHRESCEFIR